MNWRQFFGWTLVVLLVIIELAGVTCLVLAYRYNHSLEASALPTPSPTLTPTPSPTPAVEFSIVVAGDAMMHMPQLYPAMQPDGTYSFDICYHAIAPVLARYDAAVVNLETTLPGGGYSGFPRFGAPDAFAEALQRAGFGVFLMANNHCCDKDRRGIERTLSVLDSLGLQHLGVYRDTLERDSLYPVIIDHDGLRVALLNATYGTNGLSVPKGMYVNMLDTAAICADIARAKAQQADVIIMMPHWGEEYHRQPMPEQRQMARWLLSHGVDHIVGSHPHVVEPVETVEDSLGQPHVVAYSLGNLISAQQQRERSESLLLGLHFRKDTAGTILTACDTIRTRVRREENKQPLLEVVE
jgi:poly-gamma-glutamate synthesis protein (capsule biosynthesis protein)